jgi:hypothetical protein
MFHELAVKDPVSNAIRKSTTIITKTAMRGMAIFFSLLRSQMKINPEKASVCSIISGK